MRETKFRAWDKEENRMVTFEELIERNTIMDYLDEYIQVFGELVKHYKSPRIYMQYTGLKDKNGKEIYEGDILKHHSLTKQMEKDLLHQIIGKVVKEKGMTYIVGKVNNGYMDEEIKTTNYKALLLSPELFEKIGNIYDNPELLEVE